MYKICALICLAFSSCVVETVDDIVCDAATTAAASEDDMCGLLRPTTDANNPFYSCIKYYPQVAKNSLGDCIFDVCAVPGKATACKDLAVFAYKCANNGENPEGWREFANCRK